MNDFENNQAADEFIMLDKDDLKFSRMNSIETHNKTGEFQDFGQVEKKRVMTVRTNND